MKPFSVCIAIMATLIVVSALDAATAKRIQPTDRCPVCGMFVAKHTDFLAQILFSDGSYAVFDGAKDMFKLYRNIKKYKPEKEIEDITALFVTDYYSLALIDAKEAKYVIGSDIHGPMGNELIPFIRQADAEEFVRDHSGERILGFADITEELIRELDT